MTTESLVPGVPSVYLEKNEGSMPDNAVCLAHQNDAGPLYLGVADSPELGRIPGKVFEGVCYYPYGGEEQSTSDFYWVCASSEVGLHPAGSAPKRALATGFQTQGGGVCYHVIANTPHGTIPGKTNAASTCAYYSHGGAEHCADDYSYVVWKK
ncbi:uncharacterized protein LOC141914447 [Tubulanus polymorphus]|uniref:uncharacterized protein LOC141902805 n=1 Tax=Tubulanus polymorphus TaxID=672921 RepID=UPI003DA4B3FC